MQTDNPFARQDRKQPSLSSVKSRDQLFGSETASNLTFPLKPERKASISSVKSRDQLLEAEAAYFEHEIRIMKQRRTKIIGTLGDNVASAEDIKELLGSGMNIIRVNMAYCSQKTLEIIMKNKMLIEKEKGCFIPVIMETKGNTLRLGTFDLPGGEVSLKRGQEFRICTNKKLKGDENMVSCDCSDLGKLLQVGDTIVVDYGKNVLVVKAIEKENESMAALKEKFPTKYEGHGMLPKRLGFLKISSLNDYQHSCSSNEEDMSETSPKSRGSIEDKDEEPKLNLDNVENQNSSDKIEPISHRKRFHNAFKKKKKVEKDVIVCEAVSDCRLQSNKALFIQDQGRSRANPKTFNQKSFSLPEENIDDELCCINVKDIKDLNLAVKFEVDAVGITGVTSRKDIEEARFILGNKSNIRVIAKIQNADSLENFDEILEASDGIIIARSYLSMHTPVERLFLQQKEMISKCHTAGKPVTIATQILESMVSGVVPTSSEVNDIANLILDGVDALTLVSETFLGLHRKEALETLSRICYEVEYNEILCRQQQMTRELSPMFERQNYENYVIPQINPNKLLSMSDSIADCLIKAVYDLDASLIVAFTQTGSTVQKISKLRSPCPIVAVTNSDRVARAVTQLSSVIAYKVGSMIGKEGLTQKVLAMVQEKKWVKPGEFIVICFGDIEGVPGTTNTFKIVKVE